MSAADLVAFLTARLDEDEAAAKAAWGVEWDWRYVAQPFGERPSIAHTVHIARHDPARVLREVAVKRAILARWREANASRHECAEYEARAWLMDAVVRDLAAIWSDHPDYKPGMKP